MIEPTSTTPGQTPLTLREFEAWQKAQAENAILRQRLLEEARTGLERLMDARFKTLDSKLQAHIDATDRALAIAGREVERRLESLNGEQARLLADRERFLSRETYEQAQKDFATWRDTVNTALATGTGRGQGVGQFWGVLVIVIGIALTIMTVVIANWK